MMRWRLLRAWRFLRRWSGTIVWVVTMTAVALLFARQQRISADAEHAAEKAHEAAEQTQLEAGRRTHSLCISANETRKALTDLFDYFAAQAAPLTPEQQESLDFIHGLLAPLECPPEPS